MERLPPFLYAAKTQRQRRAQAKLKAAGAIRQIAPRLYTSLEPSKVEQAARASWAEIVGNLFPNALVSHRTALEYLPAKDGRVFLTGATNRTVEYPGLTLIFTRGPSAQPDDRPFLATRVSSLPRALLENLQRDARAPSDRVVATERLEERLERQMVASPEELNRIRDRARELAAQFGWRAELERLDDLVGALMGTRPDGRVVTASARARALGTPFDPRCLERLQLLFAEIERQAPRSPPERLASPTHVRHKAFFESYFSNFIEGTTFEIEEAEAIVFDKQIPAARPRDAHDIIGTFEVVSDASEMRRTPGSAAELLDLLVTRHRAMLRQRPEVEPGVLKRTANRAGESRFVSPDLVEGTLAKGFDLCATLAPGLPRAIFMMFLVTDVHPFNDGNGRIARVMMNAELVRHDQTTIIIPTVFRDDYLTSLKALTQRGRPRPLVDALTRAARFSAMDFADYRPILAELERRNWFRDPDQARIITDARS